MAGFRALERPRWFAGRLLTADDLRAEQDYLIDRLRRRNRLFHGWGVAVGLRVSIDRSSATGPSVVVAPGVAIDCAGNEIVLASGAVLTLAGLDGYRYVTVQYDETDLDPVPVGGGTAFSRIREGARVELATTNPNAGHRGVGCGTPGCGTPHPVCIATLARHGARWVVLSASHGT